MLITLPKKWQKHILNMPESGMGHQRVDVYFSDGSIEHNVVVFNSEKIALLTLNKKIINITMHK